MTVVEWCEFGAKDLRIIGREFHNGEMSCETRAWWKQVEEKETDDLRNYFC